MFDIGWQELFIIAVFALIVVGPKDLPQAIRTITTWIRKARMMTRDFQAGVNEMVREAELDDLKDTITKPGDLKKTLTDTIDADGELTEGLTFTEQDERTTENIPLGQVVDASDEDDAADDDEAGTETQLEVLNVQVDDDVMPVDEPKTETKA